MYHPSLPPSLPPSLLGLCVRSVCWDGEKVVAGTKDSEVYEISVQDKDNPRVIVQVWKTASDSGYKTRGAFNKFVNLRSV